MSLMPESNPVDDPSWHRRIDEEKEGGQEEGKMDVERDADADAEAGETGKELVLRQLHTLLLETAVSEGKLVCGKCGFEYPIKDGVGNFLLPAHLGSLGPFLALRLYWLPVRERQGGRWRVSER